MGDDQMVELDKVLIQQKLDENDYQFAIDLLAREFAVMTTEDLRKQTKYPLPKDIETIAEMLCPIIQEIISLPCKRDPDNPKLALLKQCYMALRNACITGISVQDSILANPHIMKNTLDLVKHFFKHDKEDVDIANLKMIFQFFNNLCIKNSNTQLSFWKDFEEQIVKSMTYPEIQHISVLLLFNICTSYPELLPKDKATLTSFLHVCCENDFLLFELLFTNILPENYDEFDTETRVLIMESLQQSYQAGGIEELPQDFIASLAENFKKKSDRILKTVATCTDEFEPMEVSKILNFLGTISSVNDYRNILQKDASLMINCAFLLKSIHEVGKSGANCFTPVQKLAEVFNAGEEIQEHPGFGFKAALIRMIGNLCWENKKNQDLMRELDVIPVLLDCCKIDARNPLIIQWVILAIRSICDKNQDNQKIIADMTKLGVVDSSIIQEMGLTLHQHGEAKIGIAPLIL